MDKINSRFLCTGNSLLNPRGIEGFGGVRCPICLLARKIPVNFPDQRELDRRDRFVSDCIRHHAVVSNWRTRACWLRQFSPRSPTAGRPQRLRRTRARRACPRANDRFCAGFWPPDRVSVYVFGFRAIANVRCRFRRMPSTDSNG